MSEQTQQIEIPKDLLRKAVAEEISRQTPIPFYHPEEHREFSLMKAINAEVTG